MSKLCLGLASVFFIAAMSFSGCCAPIGMIGPGCGISCGGDCGGYSETIGCGSPGYIANGPVDALRNARRRLACGAGCGETYVGEWISHPPDSVDPCHGSQFIGGATKCRPFCWQAGTLLRGLYGQRVCNGSSSCCGCSVSGGCGAPIVSSHVVSAPPASTCGCSTCVASTQHVQHSTTHIVESRPAVDNATATETVVTTKPKPAKRVTR